MVAAAALLVLHLSGLAFHSDALRVHTASTQAAVASRSDEGILDAFKCCCREAEPESCEFLAVKSKGGKDLCCHATQRLICPTDFASRKDSCFGPGVPLYDRLRAYKYAQVLDPETFLPARQGVPVRPLGAGFSGTVYLARSRGSGQLVAIKMARSSRSSRLLTAECDRVRRVHARIAAADGGGGGRRLGDGSPHVVRCLGQEKDYRPPFVALEYAGRPAVHALAAAEDQVAILHLLKQVFMGLMAMDRGSPPTIHHDMKWDNVAVGDGGCLKIIDLDSAAKGHPDKRFVRGRAFTEAYAPPELNRRGPFFECGAGEGGNDCPLAHSYDAFSAGIMAAAVLCGAPEFYAMKIAQDPKSNKALLRASQASGLSGYVALYDAGLTWALHGDMKLWSMADQARMLRNWSASVLHSIPALSGESWKDVRLQLTSAFESKLSFCESAFNSSASAEQNYSVLDWLRSHNPEYRPRPQEVLDSELFRGTDTGCSGDAFELQITDSGELQE